MPILTLLTADGKRVHDAAGLNWGFSKVAHVCKNDAYIPLHIKTIRKNYAFFNARNRTNNTPLVFEWDDGVTMTGLFEGTIPDNVTSQVYPKQISSHPQKDTLGIYIRKRIGVPLNTMVTLDDLQRYGRTDVEIKHLGGNRYSLDFHI